MDSLSLFSLGSYLRIRSGGTHAPYYQKIGMDRKLAGYLTFSARPELNLTSGGIPYTRPDEGYLA